MSVLLGQSPSAPGNVHLQTAPAPGTTIFKSPTSNTTPTPTPGRTGPWYASIPLPQLQHPSLSGFTFTSKDLERQVFTHCSAAAPSSGNLQSATGNIWAQPQTPEPDNSTLQWTGASIVQTLCSIVLTSLFPALSSAALSDLRSALTAKPFHTNLSRLLRLPENLRHATQLPLSERIIAELFEAYIGGIARELGTEQFGRLHAWYYNLIQPYVKYYHEAYLNRDNINPIPTVSSSESKLRRQNVAAYTSRLMEYAAKNKLEPPKFEYKDNGLQGAGIEWQATVFLGGAQVATAKATTKLEAKHLASKGALGILRDPSALDPTAGVTGGGQERRKRKMERRMRGGMNPGIPHQGLMIHQQPLPTQWPQPSIVPQPPAIPYQLPMVFHQAPVAPMSIPMHQPMGFGSSPQPPPGLIIKREGG
ncbi:hypothetical protein EX30DRAFT_233523 [Ascodesmis nigricans]|uniref:RNase III domain-containing protein n=1 Tax=Ascodesmis nigricans TaxID=341454 RepID=A0A4V3SIX1_9PEZI|nr:hypothetical protein EX30DRAFT_233523 [Ascodesmis nigricans]